MGHPEGARETCDVRVGFDRRVRLEFHGSKISSDGGLLLFRELDEALGLHDIAGGLLKDPRTGHNRLHTLFGLLRQSVFGRLAGYDDVNDADRLALDPVMRQVVGGRAVDTKAASASQMGRFETEVLATADNRTALSDLSGHWIDRFHERKPPKWITLDMDSSVSPTHGAQQGTAWNGHFGCMCYHPLFVFNQFGHLERCALRPGNVHSADDWEAVLKPVIERYAQYDLKRFFRGDSAFAIPKLYETLEAAGYHYAIRIRVNRVLQGKIAPLLKRPVERPPRGVKRIYGDFEYQAASWDKPRRVIAKVEWHTGDLLPRVGFVVSNLPMEPDWIIRFYNKRGTAEQHIKEGRQAGDQLDTIVVQWHGAERSPTSTSRIGLQSRCVPARHRPSRADSRLVADQPANSADQNWRKGCASRPCNHLPTRRRYSQWRSVQPHPCGYPTTARTAGS